MLADLLTNPDGFFRRRAEAGGLRGPALVVTLLALVNAVAAYPGIRASVQVLPEQAAAMGGLIYVLGLAFAFVVTFVVWALYAGVFHGLSAFAFDGEGSFGRTLSVTGWGFLPGIVGGAINAVVSFSVYASVSLPADPQAAARVAARLQSDPLVMLAGALGIAFLLWQAFLWTFAIHHVRGLSMRDAAITVGIPVAIALLWRLNGLV